MLNVEEVKSWQRLIAEIKKQSDHPLLCEAELAAEDSDELVAQRVFESLIDNRETEVLWLVQFISRTLQQYVETEFREYSQWYKIYVQNLSRPSQNGYLGWIDFAQIRLQELLNYDLTAQEGNLFLFVAEVNRGLLFLYSALEEATKEIVPSSLGSFFEKELRTQRLQNIQEFRRFYSAVMEVYIRNLRP